MSRVAFSVLTFLVACVFGAVAAGRFAAGFYGEGISLAFLALVCLLASAAVGRAR